MKNKTEFGQPIFFIDPHYDIRKCSRSLNRISGIDESTVVGQKCYHHFYHLDVPCHRCPVSRSVETKTIVEHDIQRKGPSGHVFSKVAIATPIQDTSGTVQYVIMDCLDNVAFQTKDEKTKPSSAVVHQKENKKYQAAHTILLDRDLSIMLYNTCAKSILTNKHNDIIGKNLFTVSRYFNRPEIRDRLDNFVSSDDKEMLEFEIDDQTYDDRTKYSVEKLSGHRLRDAILLRSIRVDNDYAAEKQILKEKLKISSQFASRMAHDVKNALALISTNADFIRSEAPDTDMAGTPNQIEKYVKIIQDHIKKIVTIVEYANSIKAHNWDRVAESDLVQILNRVVTITRLSKPFINHNVTLKNGEHLPRIITSELYLERALTELVKSLLLNAEENSDLAIVLSHEPALDEFVLTLTCRQKADIFSELEAKLEQFYINQKQWEQEQLGILISYAAVLIQDGSMRSTRLDSGESRITLKLPRAARMPSL